MPDLPKAPEAAAVTPQDPAVAATPPVDPPADPPADPPQDPQAQFSALYEGIPDDHPIRAELESVRQESANRRVLARTLQETNEQLQQQLTGAKTPEEFAAAVADYETKVAEANLVAAKERVGRTHGLPDPLVARLQGDTEEELTADAEVLKALIVPGTPAPPPAAPKDPPSGGLTPHQKSASAKDQAQAILKRVGNPMLGA